MSPELFILFFSLLFMANEVWKLIMGDAGLYLEPYSKKRPRPVRRIANDRKKRK